MKCFALYILMIGVFFSHNILIVTGSRITTGIERQQNDDIVRVFPVQAFEQIRITGPFVVTIISGSPFSVKASGNSQDLDAMDVSIQKSTLVIQYASIKMSKNQNIDRGVVTVTIMLPTIKKAEFLKLTRFTIKGFSRMESVELTASKLVKGSLELNAKNLKISVDGQSSLTVEGESDRLDAFLQGQSTLMGYGLRVRSVNISVESMSKAEVSVTEALRATADGMSEILYNGKPTIKMASDNTSIIKAGTVN